MEEILKSYIKYADLLVGFGVAQTFTLLYTVIKEPEFKDKLKKWRGYTVFFILLSGILYQLVLIWFLDMELVIRDGLEISETKQHARYFFWARSLALAGCTVLSTLLVMKVGTKDGNQLKSN